MENDSSFFHSGDDGRSKRGRLIGKLFGKDKDKDKKDYDPETPANVDAFLHNSADNLEITHPPPPPPPTAIPRLAKLDTSALTRYPQALAVNQQAQHNRPLVLGRGESSTPIRSPRPNKRGTKVHFADGQPLVIGEGGDESVIPTAEISKRRLPKTSVLPTRTNPVPPINAPTAPGPGPGPAPGPAPLPSDRHPQASQGAPDDDDDFMPKPLTRTQTGYSSIYERGDVPGLPPVPPPALAKTDSLPSRPSLSINEVSPTLRIDFKRLGVLGPPDNKRRSYIEIQGAQMREAEAAAFAKAHRAASATSATSAVLEHNWEEAGRPSSDVASVSSESLQRQKSMSPDVVRPNELSYSPAGSFYSNDTSIHQSPVGDPRGAHQAQQSSIASRTGPQAAVVSGLSETASVVSPELASSKLQELIQKEPDDAMELFVARTKHLFELFRLHAETVMPLQTCSLKQCARGAIWWFLRGRTGLELAIRDRPESPREQMQNEVDRQQAYANLAKGYWLLEEAAPEIADALELPTDQEVVEVEQALISALHKLSQSMKRNGFLPPEDSFLPQQVDKSIWITYAPLSQDMIALLSGNWGTGMTAIHHPMSTLRLLDALPISDSAENFNYGRVLADVYLMEQGGSGDRYHFPSFLSMVRPQTQTGLVFVLASQNGNLQLAIQDNRNAGPVWSDVMWKSDSCCLEIKLPRGFMLAVQLTQQDFRMLWNMYDFGTKLRLTLSPRPEEQVVFRNTLLSFQYIDSDPKSRSFPKEPVPFCDVALFERVYKEKSPAGPRNWHRGFRIAIMSGVRTRTMSGVHHSYPPTFPVQFGFFRAEGGSPAMSLKYENGRQRGRMVLVFSEDTERTKFHCILSGTNLDPDDKIFADVPLARCSISQSLREPKGIAPFYRMPWIAARVVNDDIGNSGTETSQTVLSDKLRLCLEYANGTVTDRINVAPGELRIRLEVSIANVLRILRQPQADFTMAVSEAQVPKELPRNMYDALQLLQNNQTIRSLEFPTLKALHEFQFAMTGFEVIFDALAATFAIARRRMVVPIHKKWEAGLTRIQVVRQDKQLQLLAFFEDFQHGHCMNFVLKGTDICESINRSGKSGIKFVDAKFPLPQLPADKDGDYDDMAFVCLDLPDLPGEHDDISILFEKENDRDLLCQCLPVQVKGSRLPSVVSKLL